jgi:hypothetical protein
MTKINISFSYFFLFLFLSYGEATKQSVVIPKAVQNILEQYCTDCHGAKKKKGDVRLHNIANLDAVFQSSLLNRIEEQLFVEKMPPDDEEQLSKKERQVMTNWLNSQYQRLGEKSKFIDKLKTPSYGNYVNHEKLFSGEYKNLKSFTSDRRWLISEFIFNAKFNKITKYSPSKNFNISGQKPQRKPIIGENNRPVNLTNPFLLPTNTGVRYYDNTILNGGHLLTMISNAKEVANFLMTERQMRSVRPMYDIMKLQFTHINTLARREKFLKDNMHELVTQIYKKDNKKYFPKFISLNIKKSPTHDANGKKIKMPNHDVAAPRNEYPAIKTAIKRYYREGQPEDELIRLCEIEWFISGVHKLKISSRLGFMINYMGEILRRNKIKPIPYKPPIFKPADYKLYSEMILKYRKKSDFHSDVIKRSINEWKQGFDAERKIIGPPSDDAIKALVKYLFVRLLDREANDKDIKKNLALMKSYTKTLGTKTAMSKLIQTLILRSEFVYRYEFGQGKPDKHGRRMMSPTDASYALSYALTDSTPDKQLLEAVKLGKLTTREDYQREVKRMLARRDQYYLIDDRLGKTVHGQPDNLTNTPVRKIRFFREFFGYPNFMPVFKDNIRFGGNYPNAKPRLLDECDRLVDHIIQKDKNVFQELLTTEKFYVYHSSDNGNMKKASDSIKEQYEYFKNMDLETVTWEEVLKHKEFITKTKFSNLRSKGDLRWFKRKVEEVRLRTGNGTLNPHPYQSKLANTIVKSQLRGISVAKFFNIKLDKWDYPTTQPAFVPNRKGILTHPAWIIAHSQNTETDPVIRGKWIREKLLAGTVPDVPITVEAVIPEDHHKTLKQRLVGVTEKKECWKCHKQMNPLGYAFEIYDDFGRFRKKESLEHPDNLITKGPVKAQYFVDSRNTYKTLPVESKGYLKGTGDDKLDGEVTDAIDLMERLGKSTKVRQSIIRHAFRYFMGRNEILSDSKTLIDADQAYVKNNGSFDAVIVSLLTSDSFIYRKEIKE